MMHKRLRAAALAATLAAAVPAAAQQNPTKAAPAPAAPTCLAPDMRRADRISWFNGFSSSDDLLTAWCRIQTLPGQKLRFNVLFRTTGMHRGWDTSFQGGALPASRIVEIVQSLIPAADGPAADENGMEFHKVLRNVVQLGAAKTPGGRALGLPASHPGSRELFLSEPIALRVRPVVLSGQEFTLTVNLMPDLGMLALGLQGQATDVILKGWKARMDVGNRFTGTCSGAIPYCEKLGDVVPFHAPWMVRSVALEASGENLTASAMAIMNQIGASQAAFLKGKQPLAGFDAKTGAGELSFSDGHSAVKVTAVGGTGGTKAIQVLWAAESGPGTLPHNLAAMFDAYRNAAAVKRETGPAAPDSLGRL